MKKYFEHKSLSIKDSNYLKGFGILLIAFHNFFHHISPTTGENEFDFVLARIQNLGNGIVDNPLNIIDLLFSYFGHYGVQIFILISGYGLMRAYGSKTIYWRSFMTKRLNKLYPTYIFAIIILAVFIFFWGNRIYPWVEYLEKLAFATNFIPGKIFSLNGPWWFYGMIVELYMVFPLLVLINRKAPKTGLISVAILSYVVMLLWGDYFISLQQSLHFHFVGNLPVFVFGMLMARKNEFRIPKIWFLLIFLIFAAGNINPILYYFSHLSIAILLFYSVLKIQKSLKEESIFSKTIYFYGEISMYLFAIHGFLRGPFIDLADKIKNPYIRPFTTLATAIVFLVFSTLIAIVLRWIVNNYSQILRKASVLLDHPAFNKLFRFSKNHIAAYLSFIVIILFFRAGEYFYIQNQHPFFKWSLYELANSLFRDILMSSVYMGLLFIPMRLLSVLSRKISYWVTIIFGILFFILYLSCIQYFNLTQTPLDKVILAYSPSGILRLIQSSSISYFIPVVLLFAISILYIILTKLFTHIQISRVKSLILIISLLLIASQLSKFYANEKKYSSEHSYYLNTFKPAYFLHSLTHALKDDSDTKTIDITNSAKRFQSAHPEKEFIGLQYPLMQKQLESSLSSFFISHSQPVKPNIVIIICESLSNSVSGKYGNYVSMTPFVDSLASQSLYWPNTVSSSERTFGALPSVLGSLPQINTGFLDLEKNIPDHLNLITTLNKQNYKTRFFYGGWANFNNMEIYLNRSNIDEINNDFPDYNTIPKNEKDFSWGYDDEAILQGSFPYLDTANPYFSLYLTLSSHSPFKLNNPENYESKVRRILNNTDDYRIRKYTDSIIPELASFAFLDDQLRRFFNDCSQRPDFDNTIFIITGDHRSVLFPQKNRLDKYHVPLIIYSPMLKKPIEFKAVVSHDDIRPSIEALLSDNFNITMPFYTQSIGNQLDTSITFHSTYIHTLIRNSRETKDIIFHDYFLSGDMLYKIHDSLNLESTENDSVKSIIKSYMKAINDVFVFVTENNKILPKNVYNKEVGALKIAQINTGFEGNTDPYYQNQISDSMAFEGSKSLSSKGNEYTSLFPALTLNTAYKNLVVNIDFQIYIQETGSKNPLIVFAGNNTAGKGFHWEGIDFVKNQHIEPGKWQHVKLNKVLFIKDKYDLGSQMKFYFWNQESSIYFIDNLRVTIKAAEKN